MSMVVTWGKVTSTSPVQVTFAGDTSGTTVGLRDDGYTVTLNDKVMLVKVGAQWIILGKVVAA